MASIELPIRASRSLAAILIGLGLAAGAAVWVAGLDWRLQLGLSMVVLAVAATVARRQLVPRWRWLRIDESRLELIDSAGRRHEGRLIGDAFVSPLFLGLRYRLSGRFLPASLGVFRCQTDSRAFRRVTVALRHGRS
ncbi:MAG: hypothetical protein HND55_07725 [Pseudomonadota bacterium]|nr:MAG: hypothetical protein HND55_07725 [Pseudomonadota bacterium]